MSSTFSSSVATGKDLVTLCRDLLILGFLVFLWLKPATIKSFFDGSGLAEVEVSGIIKMKAKDVAATNSNVNDLVANIDLLKKQLDSARQLLTVATEQCPDPAIRQQVMRINSTSLTTIASADATQAQARRLSAIVAPQVRLAQEEINTADQWGLVYGADVSLKDAKDEIAGTAKTLGFSNARIFQRQGVYRSVVVFDNRADADAALENAKSKLRNRNPYIVVTKTWCPGATEREGYTQCATAQ